MDLVAFGPTLKSPHTPDERVNIQTVAEFWEFLKNLLKAI
jgi:dipeptidase D